MERLIKVHGSGENLSVQVDSNEAKLFPVDRDIRAEELFDLLDYKKGDVYTIEKGDADEVSAGAFEYFCTLIEDIVVGINKLSEETE